jgi:hypothetical protein
LDPLMERMVEVEVGVPAVELVDLVVAMPVMV